MIPILYESDEINFTSNGLGRLRDCTRCEVTEERNSIYEVEFDYPVNGQHFSDIKCGRIIAVEHDDTGDAQPFDIYSYSMPINGVVTFHAQHISYRQNGITVISNTSSSSETMQSAFAKIKSGSPSNPFNYYSDISGSQRVAAFDLIPRTARQLLGGTEGSILDTFGGEYEWDKFNVNLWKARGQVRDYTIRYGVNLLDYQEEMDCSGVYTAVIPYWASENLIVLGDMQDSGQLSYNDRTICIPLDLSDKFEGQPTKAQVEAAAQTYMTSNRGYLPSQNIKIDFIKLSDSDEYSPFAQLQKFGLCDSVKVVFPMYGQTGTYKIVKIVYDVLQERYIEMELGNLSTSLSEALGMSNGSASNNNNSTKFQHGTIETTNVSSNTYADFSVTFDVAFSSTPTVVAGFFSSSTGYGVGSVSVSVHSVSSTGFTARLFNNDTSTRNPYITWIAIL